MTIRRIGDTAVLPPLKRIALLLLTVLFFVSVTAFAVPSRMYKIYVYDGDKVTAVSTSGPDADTIISQAGLKINKNYGDRLDLSNYQLKDGGVIVIKRGVKVQIKNYDGTSYMVYAAGTVADALKSAGISLREGTRMNYKENQELSSDMIIEIYDIFTIVVNDAGKKMAKQASGKTLSDVLSDLDVTLGDLDYTEPTLTTELSRNMELKIFRVTEKERTKTVNVNYSTKYDYTRALTKSQSCVLVSGQNGSKEVTYIDQYVNGKFASTKVKSETVAKQVVNKIVQIGTAADPLPSNLPTSSAISELPVPASLTIGANGVPTNYSSVIKAKATAYCIPGGTTSTGKRAQPGYIAVDPNEIPYGTRMYIVSADGRYVYGYCIAADTGGFINSVDWTVDLYMNSLNQCYNWGRRDIIIYVL